MGIALRMAFMFWLVTVTTGSLFVFAHAPYLKATFQERLNSRAAAHTTTCQKAATASPKGEEQEQLRAAVRETLDTDSQVLYAVIVPPDGPSTLLTRAAERPTEIDADWRPDAVHSGTGAIVDHPFANGQAYHFKYALDTGQGHRDWLHLGLSTAKYQRDMQSLYQKAAQMGLVCMVISLVVSLLYAKRMISPLKDLQGAVGRVASGDLGVRATLRTGDELEDLAASFNEMTESMEHAHDQLRQAKDQAEEANRVKTRFLANMSHEVRTPMNGIMSTLELLKGTELTTSQGRYIDTALKSSNSLLTLLSDILDISKIESGKLALEQRDFKLHQTVEDIVRLFWEDARRKGIHLGCVIDASVPDAMNGDDLRLGQILINLLANAVKFTSEGEVVVRVGAEPPEEGFIPLRISVADTGIGIGHDKQSMLFDRFTQEDSSTTRQYGGTGLGLAICRELVHLMGGEIGVDSTVGKGSTFWVRAPMKPADDTVDPKAAAPADLAARRILVVDDHEARKRVLVEQLTSWGCEVTACDSGDHAGTPTTPYTCAIVADTNEARAADIDRLLAPGARTILLACDDMQKDAITASDPSTTLLISPVLPTELLGAIAGTQQPGHKVGTAVIPPPREPTELRPPGARARILLAEDHEVNQLITRELLRKWGCDCDCVNTGKAALEAVRADDYDIVLMDCQMPEMDGYEATRAIRTLEAERERKGAPASRIPIIALTANISPDDQERCLAAGMDNCLSKPLNFNRFRQVITDFQSIGLPEAIELEESIGEAEHSVCEYKILLSRCGGREQLVQRIVAGFQDQTAADLADLGRALADADTDEVVSRAHRIKGAASNVTASALQAAAAHLEQHGKDNNLAKADESFKRLQHEFEAFVREIACQDTHQEDAQETPPLVESTME